MCRLRGDIVVRLQGLALIGIAVLCHWTNADGAALFMGCLGLLMMLMRVDRE